MTQRTKAQQIALNEKREELTAWYKQESGGFLPQKWVEDKLPAHRCIQHYMEPYLIGIVNPVIVEQYIGDNWTYDVRARKAD